MNSKRPVSHQVERDPTHSERRILRIRAPRPEDAADIHDRVQKTPSLDANSAYAYLLLCSDFADTGLVAEAGGEIVGFVLGYRPPERPEACFVWQIAVREDHRGRGLAGSLLDALFERAARDGATFLEATVTPSNRASRTLFQRFAERASAEVREATAYPSHLFPAGGHEEEVRIRIGPLQSGSLPTQRADGGPVNDMEIFEKLESEVRGYCRSFPTVFTHARGARLTDEGGREYVDFFSGAGALNYGHNDPAMKRALIEYLESDGVVHSLDMATTAKAEFLHALQDIVLAPRQLEYRVQFPGPTGTNAVEAALKLARKVTGRDTIVSFTNAFHGMTLGSLAITGNAFKRRGAGVPLTLGDTMPFDGYLGDDVDTLDYLDALFTDEGSGVDTPAAVILETVQAEGGINVASVEWLRRLERICRAHDILLVVDDIQVGCGRTGPFFSFERAGIRPDLVCLSKSLSGYGLPLAVLLIRPDLDVWDPGEHNGTFRGHNPAFVTARAALETYWRGDALSRAVEATGDRVRTRLATILENNPGVKAEIRGLGLIQGIACERAELAGRICQEAFARGLVMETAGPEGNVAKVMPPLTIEEPELKSGLDLLEGAVQAVASQLEESRSATESKR